MGFFKVAFPFAVLLCFIPIVRSSPTATINNSKIIGQTVTFSGAEANQFLGIPYAVPPVGPLRFKRPVPYTRYPKEFEAVTNPKACPQYTTDPFPWYINSTEKGEDCLYLNIWTPAGAGTANRKAVMYWIYGGGYRTGSMSSQLYNGTRLAVAGDIVVVTVNYRVGSFGFLTSNSSDAPGNGGLYDVLEGLRWVNQHIAAFGGDVSRITVAGESVGSIDVGLLAVSPLTSGLYARQIAQSGSPAYRSGDDNGLNLEYSRLLAENLGCANASFTIDARPKEVLECLRGIDAEEISRADYALAPRTALTFVPEWGGEILPRNPRDSIMEGAFDCTDLLVGTTKDEGSFLLTSFELQDLFGFFGQKNPHIDRPTGQDIIRNIASNFPHAESITDHYIPPNLTDDTDYRIRDQVRSAAGDLILLCPTVYYAEQCADQGRNVYYYQFDHRPSVSPWAPWMGVVHFDDVQFVFGQPIYNPEYQLPEYGLSWQVMDIWSSFVKYGKPNIPWPLYSKKNRTYKIIGPDTVTGKNGENGPHARNCDFLRPQFTK